jgi:hypothetical protein
MKPKKQQRKERLLKFRQEVLPKLKKIYKVTSHGPKNAPDTMYKIKISDLLIYDYYPMSEKLRKEKYSLDEYKMIWSWHDYKLDNLLEKVNKL